MASTALTAKLTMPLSRSRSRSKSLSSPHSAGARRLASAPFSCSSGVVLFSRGGGGYASDAYSVFAAASGDAAETASELILLSVQGMMCDGCAASVKRILESQPEVTSATVDFKQAGAIVWTTAEVKASEDWQKQCGEKLAKHLGTCGFESSLQVE